MTNEQLLIIANEYYPKGTNHKGSNPDADSYIFETQGDLYVSDIGVYNKDSSGLIYHIKENRWSIKKSDPQVPSNIEEIKANEYNKTQLGWYKWHRPDIYEEILDEEVRQGSVFCCGSLKDPEVSSF